MAARFANFGLLASRLAACKAVSALSEGALTCGDVASNVHALVDDSVRI